MVVARSNSTCRRGLRGFTLVELLVVIVVLAIVAAIVLPRFADSSRRSKEAAFRNDLKLLRTAVARFENDTGFYPLQINDLAVTSAPAKGIDSGGSQADIISSDWHGPYVEQVPLDPISGVAFGYSVQPPNVGAVTSAAADRRALDGTFYKNW